MSLTGAVHEHLDRLVHELKDGGRIRTALVERAFRTVERHRFLRGFSRWDPATSLPVPVAFDPARPSEMYRTERRSSSPSSLLASATPWRFVACTVDDPHASGLRVWDEAERVDLSDVAEELRAVWGRLNVREFLCSEHDWSCVLLELAEEGLPITKVPRSPQRLALQWSAFFDAITERRLTHDPDPVLARHVSHLSLISGPSGPRPDLDVAEDAPIVGILAAMVAFDGVARIGPTPEPMVILPSLA